MNRGTQARSGRVPRTEAFRCHGIWGVSPSFLGFPESSVGKESACNAGDPGSISGSGRSARDGIGYPFQYSWASFAAQLVKNLPAMQETWVWSLDWEDPLEKRSLVGDSPRAHKESDTTERLTPSLSCSLSWWYYPTISSSLTSFSSWSNSGR